MKTIKNTRKYKGFKLILKLNSDNGYYVITQDKKGNYIDSTPYRNDEESAFECAINNIEIK